MKEENLKVYEAFVEKNQILEDFTETENRIDLYLKTKKQPSLCPECGKESTVLAGRHNRTLQASPINGKMCFLHITVLEYCCVNHNCHRRTFTAEIPQAGKYRRRTYILDQEIIYDSVNRSSNQTAQILEFKNIQISHSSINRLYDRLNFPDVAEVKRIGIDDIAIRKGHKYATVISDYDTGRILYLDEGRTAISVSKWFEQHPDIQIAARDRASAYAKALKKYCPNCIQVADRFHLLQNLIEYFRKYWEFMIPDKTYYYQGRIVKNKPTPEGEMQLRLKDLNYDNSPPVDKTGNLISYKDRIQPLSNPKYFQELQDKRLKRKQRVLMVREYYQNNPEASYSAIARKMNITGETAKRYILMSQEEVDKLDQVKKQRNKREKFSDSYINIIFKMLKDGHPFSVVYNYILNSEYFRGSPKNLQKIIADLAANNFENWQDLNDGFKPKKCSVQFKTLKPGRILKLLLTKKLNEEETKQRQAILEAYPICQDIYIIFWDFHSILMSKGKRKIEEFLKAYSLALKGFCRSIKKDIAAISNAISLPISSGVVEGRNTKIKLIKRIIYGRGRTVNLRKKVQLAFEITQKGFRLTDYLTR